MMDWKQCSVPRYWGFSTLCTCSRTCKDRPSERQWVWPQHPVPLAWCTRGRESSSFGDSMEGLVWVFVGK